MQTVRFHVADLRPVSKLKPKILKLLSWQQVQELFNIYFDNMHKLLPILHPALHNPISVMARSEFLFTT